VSTEHVMVIPRVLWISHGSGNCGAKLMGLLSPVHTGGCHWRLQSPISATILAGNGDSLSPNSATVTENGDCRRTVAEIGDSVDRALILKEMEINLGGGIV